MISYTIASYNVLVLLGDIHGAATTNDMFVNATVLSSILTWGINFLISLL